MLQPRPGNRFGGLAQVGQFPLQPVALPLDRLGLIAAGQLQLLLELLELSAALTLLFQGLGQGLAAAGADLQAHTAAHLQLGRALNPAPFSAGQDFPVELDRPVGSQHLQPRCHRFTAGSGLREGLLGLAELPHLLRRDLR